ncbi:MAG: DUF2281 domain-containing protein [Methylococcaceae bacterium]
MNIAEHKLNIFRQIDELSEDSLIEVEKLIAQLKAQPQKPKRRLIGCMKGLVTYMTDDFDAPLDEFKEYR